MKFEIIVQAQARFFIEAASFEAAESSVYDDFDLVYDKVKKELSENWEVLEILEAVK